MPTINTAIKEKSNAIPWAIGICVIRNKALPRAPIIIANINFFVFNFVLYNKLFVPI